MNLLRKYVRSLLLEDVAKRKQFAQHLSDAGHTEANFDTPDVVGHNIDKVKKLVKTALDQGKLLKKAFAETADRAFLDSLVTVHWFKTKKTMEAFLEGSFSSKDELSASAYLPGEIKGGGRFGDYGILIKGHITLLANDMDQLYTGASSTYNAVFPERKKQSGINKGVEQIYEPKGYEDYKIVVLDEEDWNPSIGGFRSSQNNEALVDNWSPMAIIVPDSSNQPGYWDEDLQKMEPAGPDTAEADIIWKPLLDKAGLDIPVMTTRELVSRGWV